MEITVSFIHSRLAMTALYYFIALSLWAFYRFIRKQGLDAGFWGAVVIGEVIFVLQALLGGYMWIIGLRPARTVHVLYGIVNLLALPAVYVYTQGRQERAEMLMYAVTALITIGMILRSMETATYVLAAP